MKYEDAGVNINKANEAIDKIKKKVKSTYGENVLTDIGSFGGLFSLKGYNDPVLVSGTDGVGTKLKLAFLNKNHSTVGIDLVAMSVNDILVQGATPLFFLDYIATSNLKPDQMEEVIDGIVKGCKMSKCALLGGEMAELPGFYKKDEYDLAGFAVGACEKNEIITGKKIASDDVIIGLKSSGIHSNGFSLVRKVLIDEKNPDKDLIDKLLTPTRIYVKPVLNLKEKIKIKGMVHVTGGGFYENIPRILPDNLDAIINKGSWDIPEIFKKIQEAGGINEKEMFRTFNMGIGYIIVVKENDKEEALDILSDSGENPVLLGKIITGKNQVNFN